MDLEDKNDSEITQRHKQNAASIAAYVAQDASNQLLRGERLAAVGRVDDFDSAVGCGVEAVGEVVSTIPAMR